MGFLSTFFGDTDTPKEASALAAGKQQEALDYLQQQEALPSQLRQGALGSLGGLLGLPGGTGSQQDLIQRAMESPLYKAIMGGQEAGEQGIMRSAAATGGLRSGDVQSNMYKFNTELANQALLESYNQQLEGLTGLADLPSNANMIAQQMTGIGETLAQGRVGVGEARRDRLDRIMEMAGKAGKAGMLYSDKKLKDDIKFIKNKNGYNWYKWKWNKIANNMGLFGESFGVLANEILKIKPNAVLKRNEYLMVDYSKL
jgi:hypothetical protein